MKAGGFLNDPPGRNPGPAWSRISPRQSRGEIYISPPARCLTSTITRCVCSLLRSFAGEIKNSQEPDSAKIRNPGNQLDYGVDYGQRRAKRNQQPNSAAPRSRHRPHNLRTAKPDDRRDPVQPRGTAARCRPAGGPALTPSISSSSVPLDGICPTLSAKLRP